MSLRTSYTGALDSKLAEARAAGKDWVLTTNITNINNDLALAASRGQKKFTVSYTASYQPADLRLLGALWEAFQTGIKEGLASEDIMQNEFTIKLNTSDQLATNVDILFAF